MEIIAMLLEFFCSVADFIHAFGDKKKKGEDIFIKFRFFLDENSRPFPSVRIVNLGKCPCRPYHIFFETGYFFRKKSPLFTEWKTPDLPEVIECGHKCDLILAQRGSIEGILHPSRVRVGIETVIGNTFFSKPVTREQKDELRPILGIP